MYRTIYLLFGVLFLVCCGNGGDTCRWAADEETYILIRDGFDHTNDPQEALPYFDKALQRDPLAVGAYYYRALTRYELGDVEGAISDASEVIRLCPDAKEGYSLRARFYKDQGRLLESARDELAHDRAAKTFGDYGRQALDRELAKNPDAAQLYYKRGNMKFYKGDYQGAVEDYDEYLRLLGDKLPDEYALRRKAIALEELGDYQGAIESYEAARKVHLEVLHLQEDDDIDYLDRIARLRRAMGDIEGAEAVERRIQEWIRKKRVEEIQKIYTEINQMDEEIGLIDRKLELEAGKGGMNEDARVKELAIVDRKLKEMFVFEKKYKAVPDDLAEYRARIEKARRSLHKSIYRKWLDLKEYDKAADAVEDFLKQYPDTSREAADSMRKTVSRARRTHWRWQYTKWLEVGKFTEAEAAVEEYLARYPDTTPGIAKNMREQVEEARMKAMQAASTGTPSPGVSPSR